MKSKNGITLVALAVTIVVLLILAGVTISALTGNNGIINGAKAMASNTEEKVEKSNSNINSLEAKLAKGEAIEATASPQDVIKGKTYFSDSNGTLKEGTMPENEAKAITLNAGGSYTIPQGYHNGEGIITVASLSMQTSATAVAEQLIEGVTAWVNGSKITGTMVNRGQYQYGGWESGSDYFAINALPEGAYYSNGESWAPEARINKETVYNYFGGYRSTVGKNGCIGMNSSYPNAALYPNATNLQRTAALDGQTYVAMQVPSGVYDGGSYVGVNISDMQKLMSSEINEAYQNGYNAGKSAGYNDGYNAGKSAGYNDGYSAGNSAGYNNGYNAGASAVNNSYPDRSTVGVNGCIGINSSYPTVALYPDGKALQSTKALNGVQYVAIKVPRGRFSGESYVAVTYAQMHSLIAGY